MTSKSHEEQIIQSTFRAPWWLRNPHLQTIYPNLPWSWPSRPRLRRETLKLPDGDITAVDWLIEADSLPNSSPLLIILHGLEGSSESAYVRMLMEAAFIKGWRSCVLLFRDCGDHRNRLPRRYHAGETNDLRYFLDLLYTKRSDFENAGPLLAAGYSLGGNVLLKYLGESQSETPLAAATAVCVPLNLHISAKKLNIDLSRIYQKYLLKRMKSSITRKFNRNTKIFDWDLAMSARTFAEFDEYITAPLHGFDGVNDYYDRCSSTHFLGDIERPTLIINSLDDPFMGPDVLPTADKLAKNVTLEIARKGGHVGFINGGTPFKPTFFLPRRITDFLESPVSNHGLEEKDKF
ncbi:MAG: hydrolase [Woeseiaceae bacterium]|nr:hydrolase [Woeseiaceae bacterium]